MRKSLMHAYRRGISSPTTQNASPQSEPEPGRGSKAKAPGIKDRSAEALSCEHSLHFLSNVCNQDRGYEPPMTDICGLAVIARLYTNALEKGYIAVAHRAETPCPPRRRDGTRIF